MSENIDIVVKEIGAQIAAEAIKKIGESAAQSAAPLAGLNSAIETLKGTLVSLGLLLSGKQVLDMADHYTVVIDKLKKYATSNEDLIQTEQKLNDIALATRQRMDEVASVYTGLARASQGAGVSQKELLDATTSISKAMTTMGASAGDVSEVMKRLAFSMQSGMQPGRAIAQLFIQFPALGAAISKELGVSAKEFLNMARSGQLSMKQIVDAMGAAGQSGKSLSNAFNATTVTLSSAFTTLGGQVARAIGLFDQGSGVSRAFAESVLFLANHIDGVLSIVRAFSVGLAAYAIATYAASAATVTFTGALTTIVAILSRPAVIIAAVAAAISLLAGYFKDFKITADGSVTAMGVLSGAFNLLKQAASFVLDSVLKPLFAEIQRSPALFAVMTGALIAFGAALSAAFGSAVLLGIGNLIAGIAGLTAGFISMLAAIAPVVLGIAGFTAAVVAGIAIVLKITDAIGLTKNAYQDFANMLESTANAALNKVTDAFKTATDAAKQHALAQVEVKAKTGEAAQSAADASQAWYKLSDAFKEVHASSGAAGDSMKSLGDSYLTGASDADKWADANKRLVDSFQKTANSAKKSTTETSTTTEAVKTYGDSLAGLDAQIKDTEANSEAWYAILDKIQAKIIAIGQAQRAAYDQWAQRMAQQSAASAGTVTFGYGPQNQGEADKDPATALSFAGPVGHVNYDPWYIATFGSTTTQAAIDRWKASHGLAHGGTWNVGGSGSTDSQLVQFMASPNEEISVRTPSQQRDNSDRGDTIIVNMHINGVQDTRDFNRNMGQIASKVRSQLSRRT